MAFKSGRQTCARPQEARQTEVTMYFCTIVVSPVGGVRTVWKAGRQFRWATSAARDPTQSRRFHAATPDQNATRPTREGAQRGYPHPGHWTLLTGEVGLWSRDSGLSPGLSSRKQIASI